MKQKHSSWLPRSAIDHKKVRNSINCCINTWCADWFVESLWGIKEYKKPLKNINVSKGKKLQHINSKNNQNIFRFAHPQGLSLTISEDGLLSIARAMLAKQLDYKNIRSNDLSLIKQIAQESLNNLHTRLGVLFSLAESDWKLVSNNSNISFSTEVTDNNYNKMLTIEVPHELLVSLIKSLAPKPRSPKPCDSFNSVVCEHMISLSADIGNTKLNISEIKGLSIGDIISFETKTDSYLDINVSDKVKIQDVAELKFNENNMYLEIKRDVLQW